MALSVDETKTPKAQPQRRISYHVRQKVNIAMVNIALLEKEDVIEKGPENELTL